MNALEILVRTVEFRTETLLMSTNDPDDSCTMVLFIDPDSGIKYIHYGDAQDFFNEVTEAVEQGWLPFAVQLSEDGPTGYMTMRNEFF
jgi:hypothetical protein